VEALNRIKLGPEAGTLPADEIFADSGSALPFAGEVSPPTPVAHAERDPLGETRTAFHELEVDTLPFDKRNVLGPDHDFAPTPRLEAVEEPAVAEQPPPSAPSQPQQLPQHLEVMTLEQYAALRAECAVSPEWQQQIHARYGIRSSGEREALDQHWQAQMQGDQNVANTYQWHFARYEEWARSRK
jgi:hypothetical protein